MRAVGRDISRSVAPILTSGNTSQSLGTLLPSSLSDGYVDSRDIEALRNQKGVGEWSVEQLQQLRDTGACSYLMALRARRRQ